MCNCIEQINKLLEEHNTRLALGINMRTGKSTGARIAVEKIESKKRKGPVDMYASYCPFCGEKYKRDNSELDSEK